MKTPRKNKKATLENMSMETSKTEMQREKRKKEK